MNEKEIAEIRRRFRQDKNNISHIHGCFVNEKREIISEFSQSLTMMPQEESELMLALLKKTLSGTLDKNLIDITFATQQVVDGEEHKLLMAMRNSTLKDTEAVKAFYQRVIDSLVIEGNYLILLAQDTYDVPYRSKDGAQQEDASSEVYSYFLCSVCPVKMTKPALSYQLYEKEFHNLKTDWIVSSPELGFLFPTFDDRSSNIYNALYYTRNTAENHQEFVDAVFCTEIPMPAAVQKETFETILGDTLSDDCSFEVVQSVHGQLCNMIEEHKVNKEVEPLTITKEFVRDVLESCGISEEHAQSFEEKYNHVFGEETDLSPKNIVDHNKFEISTPDVTIRVKPERSQLIQTRVIDGVQYIMIRADEDVEVNGVKIHIS